VGQRVIVVGATGTIGRPFCEFLIEHGYGLVVFSRDPARAEEAVPGAERYVAWSSTGGLSAECVQSLRAADAVVYLAGGPLFDGRRHSRDDVEQETASRVRGIDTLVAALGKADRRPATFIAASSVGYYGYAGRTDAEFTETSPPGADWWGASSAAIERAALAASPLGIRTVVLRTGYVLTTQSLQSQVAQFDRHFGGWIGLGRGWTPWIHIADEVSIIIAALEGPAIEGPVNATAPQPVRSQQFAKILGRVLRHRAWLPVPTPLVRMGLGEITDIIVKGKQVLPAKALANGYRFQFPTLPGALQYLLTEPSPTGHPQP
jgi:uncharacterized protein